MDQTPVSPLKLSQKSSKTLLKSSSAVYIPSTPTSLIKQSKEQPSQREKTDKNFRSRSGDKLAQTLVKLQSQEMIKLLTEKSMEIRRLQDDKLKLQQRISELTNHVKGLKALPKIIKEKDKQIEDLERLIASKETAETLMRPRIRGSSSQPIINLTDRVSSVKSSRETPKSRRTPKISVEESLSSLLDEFMYNRPVTTLARTSSQVQILKSALASPYFMPTNSIKKKRKSSFSKSKSGVKLTDEMENALRKLEINLEGWEAAVYFN